MSAIDDKVQIGNSADFLEGVAVDTSAGNGLFREGVVVSDPESAEARQRVTNTAPLADDYGSVVRVAGSIDTGLVQPTTPSDTQPISGAVEVHSEYLFSGYQASLADGAEIDSGWLDMGNVDKYQFEGLASTPGMTQIIESSSGAGGTGAAVSTSLVVSGVFQLFNVIARQRYMRFRWQNNTGSAVTNAALSIKASYGSSDKLSVLSLNTTPSDFSQSVLTQSVLFGLNEVTSQRAQVALSGNNNLIVALGDRISQTGGRTHLEINMEDVTTGVQYTVPVGHNLHVTSIEWAGASTSTAAPVRAKIRDGGAVGALKYSFAINEPSAFATQAGNGGLSYPEPTLFETDVYFELVTGAFSGDVLIVGYLEPI